MGISILAWLSSRDPILAQDGVEGQYGSRDDNPGQYGNAHVLNYLLHTSNI